MTSDSNKMLPVALEAVRRASRATLCAFEQGVGAEEKEDGTPLTLADLAAQSILLSHLEGALGPQPIWAEESGTEVDAKLERSIVELAQASGTELSSAEVTSALGRRRPTGDSYWAVDPLDGTRGFVRGDQWAIAMAWVVKGRPQLAVVGLPRFGTDGIVPGEGCLLWAERGEGAFMSALEDGPTESTESTGPIVSTGPIERLAVRGAAQEPYRIAESAEYEHTIRIAEKGKPSFEWTSLRADGQVKYGLLATNRADLYVRAPRNPRYKEKVWDHAPGSLIAEECGIRVADFDGQDLDFSKPPHFFPAGGIFAGPRPQWEELMTLAPGPRTSSQR